jgi:hypothetical protein
MGAEGVPDDATAGVLSDVKALICIDEKALSANGAAYS